MASTPSTSAKAILRGVLIFGSACTGLAATLSYFIYGVRRIGADTKPVRVQTIAIGICPIRLDQIQVFSGTLGLLTVWALLGRTSALGAALAGLLAGLSPGLASAGRVILTESLFAVAATAVLLVFVRNQSHCRLLITWYGDETHRYWKELSDITWCGLDPSRQAQPDCGYWLGQRLVNISYRWQPERSPLRWLLIASSLGTLRYWILLAVPALLSIVVLLLNPHLLVPCWPHWVVLAIAYAQIGMPVERHMFIVEPILYILVIAMLAAVLSYSYSRLKQYRTELAADMAAKTGREMRL